MFHSLLGKKITLAALALVFLSALCHAQNNYHKALNTSFKDADSSAKIKDEEVNKIVTSLFYRGEIADTMLETGFASTVVDISKARTYSEARAAVISWIANNPKKAADYSIMFSNGVKRKIGGNDIEYNADGSITRTIYKYSLSDSFMAKIMELTAAASNKKLSAENLSDTSRNLFDGVSAYQDRLNTDFDSLLVSADKSAGNRRERQYKDRKKAVYSGKYDDIKLNRAALEKETNRAEYLLASLRGSGKGPKGAEKFYAYAQQAYGNFAGYASPLKGRKIINEEEAKKLENYRAELRKALAGLSLRLMAVYSADMAGSLEDDNYCAAMRISLIALAEKLNKKLEEAQSLDDLQAISNLLAEAQAEFSKKYMDYTAYKEAVSIEEKSKTLGFSCLADLFFFKLMSFINPHCRFVEARMETPKNSLAIKEAIAISKGASQNILFNEALDKTKTILNEIKFYSAYSAYRQYLGWGILFRPYEIKAGFNGVRLMLRPYFPWFVFCSQKYKKP